MSKHIDRIIYINLEHRKDRLSEIENELEITSLKQNSERFEAIKCIPGIAGCGYSHLSVLKLAKERKYRNVLILEDDFTFLVTKEEFEFELTRFFETVKEFDVCMLSYNLQRSEPTEHPFLIKALEVQTASAYIVNERFYDKLITLYEDVIPKLEKTDMHWLYANDQCWKGLQQKDRWFYFKNRIGKQRASYSDNSMSFMDYGK
jgi:GR25 family glycosyltransferase involved in LPS biosynthesis